MTARFAEDTAATPDHPRGISPTARLRTLLAVFFSLLFMALSIAFGALSVREFIGALDNAKGMTSGLIASINAAVISLAAFELGFNVGKEYVQEGDDDIYAAVRRSIARFVGVVCIALVLEGLIMVIKYSQLELAGNLGYPVAIIGGASVLLMALGVFLYLTRPEIHAYAMHGLSHGNRHEPGLVRTLLPAASGAGRRQADLRYA